MSFDVQHTPTRLTIKSGTRTVHAMQGRSVYVPEQSEVGLRLTDSWRARLPKRGEMGPERGVPAGLAPWTGLKVKSSSEAPAA